MANYMGAHSDRHLLYADWTKRDSLLVTKEHSDHLQNNYQRMAEFGIKKKKVVRVLSSLHTERCLSEWAPI